MFLLGLRKREERLQARELNQLMKEVKEDMELTDHTPLPDVPRLQGLRLPPEAFGNILMVFEFLHNFGETLGFGEWWEGGMVTLGWAVVFCGGVFVLCGYY